MRKIILLLLFIPFFLLAELKEEDKKAVDDANQKIGAVVKEKAGYKSALRENFATPLMSNENLKTFDGKKDFEFKLSSCSAGDVFLKMTTQPVPNGKIKILTIEQDTTMDGNIDYVSTPNVSADIVCNNGLSICSDVDEMSTCNSFRWTSVNKKVSLAPAPMSDLAACYCISGKCGINLAWNNRDTVIKDLASGAAQALTYEDPYYSVSSVQVDEIQGIVKGGQAGCNVADASDITVSPNKTELLSYQKDPNKMKSDAEDKTTTSLIFDSITKGSLNPDEQSAYRTCEIRREPQLIATTIDDIIALDTGHGGISGCGEDCIQLTLGTIGDNYWSGYCTEYKFGTRFYVKRPELIKSAILVRAQFDDWIQVRLNNKFFWSGPYNNWNFWTEYGVVPGECELSTSWDMQPNVSFLDELPDKPGPVNFDVRVNVSGRGDGYVHARIIADLSCLDKEDDLIIDGCAAYSQDNSCVLEEEEIDGVKSFFGGATTGLIPLPQTKTIINPECSVELTKPWYHKKRKYRCDTNVNYDLSKMTERAEKIVGSTTATDYQDVTFDKDGVRTNGSGKLYFDGVTSVENCTQACKVRTPKPVDVTLTGTVDDLKRHQEMQYDISYKTCYRSLETAEYSCDLEGDEEIVTPCQCSNNFAEAVAAMQVLRMAGQDMICSTGDPKMPQ